MVQKKKCIILVRVSTFSQDLTQQTNELLKKANLLGYATDDIIIDQYKESAIKLAEEDRVTLNQMKSHIETGEVDLVLIWEITRLSRKLAMLYNIRDYLQQKHVQLVCMQPDFTLFDKDWKISQASNIIFSLYSVLAESEMQIKRERFARAKAKMRAENKFTGGKILYGYDVTVDKTFIVHPRHGKVVKRMFSLYESGQWSGRQIAELLYKEGVINQSTKASRDVWVCKVLGNSAYTGDSFYPPLISMETYQKVKTMLSRRQFKAREPYDDSIYLGHKLLYNGDRQFLIRKKDKSYIDKSTLMHININMVDSLLVYCTEQSLNKHRSADKKSYKKQLLEETESVSKRLITYNEREQQIIKRIDKIEERVIYGKLTSERANELEHELIQERNKLIQDRQNDIDLANSLSRDLNAIHEKYEARSIYDYTVPEQYKIIRGEIREVQVSRIRNSHYKLTIHYIHRLVPDEEYEILSKKHLFYKDEVLIDVPLIKRFERKKKNS